MKAFRSIVHGVLLAAALALTLGIALAQAASPAPPVGWADIRALFTPEVMAGVVFVLAGLLTGPLTALAKNVIKSEGVTTQTVNAMIVAFLAGLIPYAAGAYGYSAAGLVYALIVTLLRALADNGIYKRQVQTQTSALEKSAPVTDARGGLN
jgi:hypothetical protein